jgi:hypothetical protein
VRYEAEIVYVSPGVWNRDIVFFSHDTTVCDAPAVTHKTARRLKAIQGAGTLFDGVDVKVWRDIRIFRNGVAVQSKGVDQLTMNEDNEVHWQYWNPGNEEDVPTIPTRHTVYFKVGSWQGDDEAYTSVASTPDL